MLVVRVRVVGQICGGSLVELGRAGAWTWSYDRAVLEGQDSTSNNCNATATTSWKQLEATTNLPNVSAMIDSCQIAVEPHNVNGNYHPHLRRLPCSLKAVMS